MSRKRKYDTLFKQYQVVGEWTVLDPIPQRNAEGRAYVKCRCLCSTVADVSCYSLETGQSTQCEACNYSNRSGKNNPNWQGGEFDKVPSYITKRLVANAFSEPMEGTLTGSYATSYALTTSVNELTPELLYQMYLNQSESCAISGLPLSFHPDSQKYEAIIYNNQLIAKDVMSLTKETRDKFIRMCCAVAKKYHISKEQENANQNQKTKSKSSSKGKKIK